VVSVCESPEFCRWDEDPLANAPYCENIVGDQVINGAFANREPSRCFATTQKELFIDFVCAF
jgi:hypothetical protein